MLFVNENSTFSKIRINSPSQNLFAKMKLKQLNIGRLLKQGFKNWYTASSCEMVYFEWISFTWSILNRSTDLVDTRMKSREPILIVLFCDLEMSDWRDKMRQKILLQRPISWFIGPVFTLRLQSRIKSRTNSETCSRLQHLNNCSRLCGHRIKSK